MVLVVALLGVAYGIYYAADRYLLTALGSDPIEGEVETVSTTTVFASTTTTTESREDRVVAGAADRYGTAIGVSKLGFPDGAPALVLVPGDDYSEGVGAAPLAAAHAGAILLVPPDGLTDELSAEIVRLGPKQVFLVGLSRPNGVTEQLQDILTDPEVKVLQGDDPAETAALVAQEVAAELGTVEKVVIVPSDSFADAIAVAPLAAAQGWPILLAEEDGDLSRATTAAINDLGVTSALVVGIVVDVDLDDVEREVGADSDETAALLVAYALEQGMTFEHVVIASGSSFPEALVAGPYVARDNAILLLAKDGALPAELRDLLDDNMEDVRVLDILALPQLAQEFKGTTSTTGGEGSSTTATTAAAE
jgi:putative cell wall-binding protein